MPFDKSLDEELFSESAEFEITKIKVSVHSYNGARAKMQLTRENRNQNTGDWGFSKLGRMTKDEAEKVIPLMQKALEKM